MTRFLRRVCTAAAVAGLVLFGMAGAAQNLPKNSDVGGPRAAFDVATIRPSDPLNTRHHISILPGGKLEATITVETLLERAYGIRSEFHQIVGAPAWVATANYDIVAKSDESEDVSRLTPDQDTALWKRQMQRIQSLLADRFQLKFHSEVRQLPVFALVVAKGGPKLQTPKAGEARSLYRQRPGNLACTNASMFDLADELQDNGVGRPVVDKTGLTGRYDFTLRWTPDDILADSASPDSGLGSLFTASQEQLGLKLEPQKGPVEVLVIDHIERPSAN